MNRLLVCILLVLTPTISRGITYDAAQDFDRAENPNGVWSYGWKDTTGFHLFTTRTEVAPNVFFWTGGDGPLGEPTAGKNEGSDTTGVSPTMFYDPEEFALHPGRNGELAVLRWTSPETRVYRFDSVLTGVDNLGTTTDVYVSQDDLVLGGGLINCHNSVEVSGTLLVNEGQTLDFLVGYGVNRTFWSDTTRLDVSVTTG